MKRKYTHCLSSNLKAETKQVKGYNSYVFDESFICKSCGAESVKSSVFTKKESIPMRFLKYILGN